MSGHPDPQPTFNAKGESMNRLYFMDSMRSVLMLLGVILHSAQVFNPEKSWVIYSEFSLCTNW